jgi:hypothetical protein
MPAHIANAQKATFSVAEGEALFHVVTFQPHELAMAC